jgi:hypothetical protein
MNSFEKDGRTGGGRTDDEAHRLQNRGADLEIGAPFNPDDARHIAGLVGDCECG